MPESPAPLQWSFSQAFGKRRPPENLQDCQSLSHSLRNLVQFRCSLIDFVILFLFSPFGFESFELGEKFALFLLISSPIPNPGFLPRKSLDDIITSIAFEKRGDYLAVGDRCGRVVLFESDHKENVCVIFLSFPI